MTISVFAKLGLSIGTMSLFGMSFLLKRDIKAHHAKAIRAEIASKIFRPETGIVESQGKTLNGETYIKFKTATGAHTYILGNINNAYIEQDGIKFYMHSFGNGYAATHNAANAELATLQRRVAETAGKSVTLGLADPHLAPEKTPSNQGANVRVMRLTQ